MSKRDGQRDKKKPSSRRQSKDKAAKQTGKPGTPKGSNAEKSKSKSKSDGKSQSIKSHVSAPSDDKSKSSSGGRRRIGTMGVADDDDNFDEFHNQPAVVKSLAHKSVEREAQDKDDGPQDLQTTLWNKSWMDEDDDVDFGSVYEKEKK